MCWKSTSFWIGIFIVLSTHIGMFVDLIPMATKLHRRSHAIANLVAAGLILYAWF